MKTTMQKEVPISTLKGAFLYVYKERGLIAFFVGSRLRFFSTKSIHYLHFLSLNGWRIHSERRDLFLQLFV